MFSVFLSPRVFTVLHGRQEIGFVDELSFLGKKDGPRILLLGGKPWLVNHIDWQRRLAYVEAAVSKGASRWHGTIPGLSYPLCQSIKRVLTDQDNSERWSRRATEQLAEIRHEFDWLTADATVVLVGRSGDPEWWTFAGTRANATLSSALAEATQSEVDYDEFCLTFETRLSVTEIQAAVEHVKSQDVLLMRPSIDEGAISGLKFSGCLPMSLSIEMLQERLVDTESTKVSLQGRVRYIAAGHGGA